MSQGAALLRAIAFLVAALAAVGAPLCWLASSGLVDRSFAGLAVAIWCVIAFGAAVALFRRGTFVARG